MITRSVLLLASLATLSLAQRIGKAKDEVHLAMPVQHCTKVGGCKFEPTKSVLDSNWRWTHKVGCTKSSKCNCYLGKYWVNATCSSVSECSQTCALDGEDEKGYKVKYGIEADGQGCAAAEPSLRSNAPPPRKPPALGSNHARSGRWGLAPLLIAPPAARPPACLPASLPSAPLVAQGAQLDVRDQVLDGRRDGHQRRLTHVSSRG